MGCAVLYSPPPPMPTTCRYCCDNSTFPCSSPSRCAGNRAGPLCGDCVRGHVETIGSSQCGAVAKCPHDRKIAWVVVVTALLFVGAVQLTVVSGVGRSRAAAPSGRLKLVIYYAQVREKKDHPRMGECSGRGLLSAPKPFLQTVCVVMRGTRVTPPPPCKSPTASPPPTHTHRPVVSHCHARRRHSRAVAHDF